MVHGTLDRRALDHRSLLMLADSFHEVTPVQWVRAYQDPEGYVTYLGGSWSLSDDGYLLFSEVPAPGLIKVNGQAYHEVDAEHVMVPLPAGNIEITLEVSPYADFGEPSRPSAGRAYVARMDPDAFQLYLLVSYLLDLASSSDDPELPPSIYQAVTSALARVIIAHPGARQLDAVRLMYRGPIDLDRIVANMRSENVLAEGMGSVLGADKALAELGGSLRDLVERFGKRGLVAAVGHAHLDAAWLWPFSESRRKAHRTFATVVTLMGRHRDVTFVQSSSLYYEWLKEDDPALFKKVRDLVDEGRWDLGAGYVEFDANLPSGESIARQLLYSQAFYLKEFGRLARVLWLPDSFGFAATLPQIARLAGVEAFMTHKVSWNDTNRFPYSVLKWVGPDGTSLPSIAFGLAGRGYNGNARPSDVLAQWRAWQDKEAPMLYSYGYGDGGGGPSELMILGLQRLNDLPLVPNVKSITPTSYLREVSPRSEWREAIYVETHRGTYTSHANVKALHEDAQRWLREAELWATLAGARDPELIDLWKVLLRSEFHDVLPGSAIARVYDEVRDELNRVIVRAQEKVARYVGSPNEGESQAVVNSMPWARRGYVELTRPVSGCQRVGESCMAYVEAPAVGFAGLTPRDPADRATAYVEGEHIVLENSALRAVFSKEGALQSLRLKRLGWESIREPSNLIYVYQNSPGWADAWDVEPGYESSGRAIKAIFAEVAAEGPLVASASFRYSFEGSWLEQEARVYAGMGLLELRVRAMLTDRDRLVKAWYHFNVNNDVYMYGAPMGFLERTASCNTPWERARFEVPFQKVIDLFQADRGVAVLSPKRHGASVCMSSIGLTLLRSPTFPDPRADMEEVRFSYAILPHQGDWRSAGVARAAYEYWAPMFVVKGSGADSSLLSLEPHNLVLEAVKAPEEGDGLVLRIYEAHNVEGWGELRLPFQPKEVRSLDLLETTEVHRELKVNGNLVEFHYRPREVITLLVR